MIYSCSYVLHVLYDRALLVHVREKKKKKKKKKRGADRLIKYRVYFSEYFVSDFAGSSGTSVCYYIVLTFANKTPSKKACV